MQFSAALLVSLLTAATAVSAYHSEDFYERDLYARDAYPEASPDDVEFLNMLWARDAGRSPSPMRYVLTCHMSQCDSACHCDADGKVQCNSAVVTGVTISASQMTSTCRGSCHC